MSFSILLRRRSDGKEIIVDYADNWSELMEFMWLESNCACDCYRAQKFGDVAPCGNALYDAVHVWLPDGTKLPLDDL